VIRIGYLARICPEKGLHLLVEAVDRLVQSRGKDGLRLETAGYLGDRDRSYFEKIQAQISKSGWQDRHRHWGEVDRREKIRFLSSLDLLSVPTVYRDPKGIFVLEALANGVAVVQPAHGSFPEWIAKTGGGRLVEPNSPGALAEGLDLLIENEEERARMAGDGKQAVFENFNSSVLAENALRVYRRYVH
jgi:glycosyltransferase involved in cell wall biosynthesis